MIEKKDILKMVKNVSKRAQGKPDKRLIHPRREWIIGLLMFFVVLTAGAVLSMQVYTNLNNLESSIVDTDTRVIRYQASNVEIALDRYSAAAENFTAIADTIETREAEDLKIDEDSAEALDTADEISDVDQEDLDEDLVVE